MEGSGGGEGLRGVEGRGVDEGGWMGGWRVVEGGGEGARRWRGYGN